MGEYRCKLCNEWHWDGQSYICPVFRDKIEGHITKRHWKKLELTLEKMLELGFHPNALEWADWIKLASKKK